MIFLPKQIIRVYFGIFHFTLEYDHLQFTQKLDSPVLHFCLVPCLLYLKAS